MLASNYFFFYTLLGSVTMLFSLFYIYVLLGTTNYEILLILAFSSLEQKLLWLGFFVAFAGKIPMMPLHLWLPEAHVEAECNLENINKILVIYDKNSQNFYKEKA